MSNKIVIDKKKEDFITYYKNELFELEHGSWVLDKSGRSCGYHTTFKLDNVCLPDKIYNKCNQIPIYSPIIEDIKYMIDSCPVDSFDNKILYTLNCSHNHSGPFDPLDLDLVSGPRLELVLSPFSEITSSFVLFCFSFSPDCFSFSPDSVAGCS